MAVCLDLFGATDLPQLGKLPLKNHFTILSFSIIIIYKRGVSKQNLPIEVIRRFKGDNICKYF